MYLSVVAGPDCKVAEIIVVQESVECIGSNDYRRWNGDIDTREVAIYSVLVEQYVDERKPPRLSTQRAAADPRETAARIESRAIEIGDHAPIPISPVLVERTDEILPEILQCGIVRHLTRSKPVSERKLGPHLEPVREVVPLGVIPDTFQGNCMELMLQALQVAGTPDIVHPRHAEHEIAETEALDHELPELIQQNGRALEEEGRSHLAGEFFVPRVARLEHHRQVGSDIPDGSSEFYPRLIVQPSLPRKLDVRDDPERLVGIGIEIVPGFLVTATEQNLGPSPDPHDLVGEIDPFG